jgi:hypothetical protein
MIDTVTCQGHPTAEQLEASARRRRESTAIYACSALPITKIFID